MAKPVVAVLGATSLVGRLVVSLLEENGFDVRALSRVKSSSDNQGAVLYKQPEMLRGESVALWICLAPVWVVKDYFNLMASCGVRRIVALSSTSRFTKSSSSDSAEKVLAEKLAKGESNLTDWAQQAGVEWTILRPTLIYGLGQDKNVSEIARFIRKFRLFPLLGTAQGLRQPVHAEDVAKATVAALTSEKAANRSYNLSGGETLPYRSMVTKIFEAHGWRPLFLPVPIFAFQAAIVCARLLPRYRNLSVAMAERMNQDLVFDHVEAKRDLLFEPRGFVLSPSDLPKI